MNNYVAVKPLNGCNYALTEPLGMLAIYLPLIPVLFLGVHECGRVIKC